MTPFFKNAEPHDKATAIKLYNDNDAIEIPIELLPYLFFQFAKMANDYIATMPLIALFMCQRMGIHMNSNM